MVEAGLRGGGAAGRGGVARACERGLADGLGGRRILVCLPAARWLRAWCNVAAAFDIAPGRVGLKATTLEGLGALGRAEGIACQAAALVRAEGESA